MSTYAKTALISISLALALAACGKKTDPSAPLAFVPADTPYVIANVEGVPEAISERWALQIKSMWPVVTRMYGPMIDEIGKKDESTARVLHAVLDEFRERDTPEKWREVGLSSTAHSALYGVGLLPVLRIELTDADAFRAMVARIEQKGGAKFGTARIGDQDVWTFGPQPIQGLIAIEGKHLVLTAVPAQADDALKRRVLGLDRPQKSLADSGALTDFNKQRGYLPYGSGWIDTRRVLALFSDDPAVAAAAQTAGEAPPKLDAVCRSELDALAAQAPMFAFGYTEMEANRMSFRGRLDLAPALAKSLAALPGALPPASADSLFNMGIALPILRARDFLVAQADAVAKAPFQCATLAPLNGQFAEMRGKLDQMIPPPLADLVGVRVSVDKFAWPAGAKLPQVSAHALIASANPAFLTNLAQVSVPALAKIKFEPNGQPIAIPAGVVPGVPADVELHAAMSAHMLGVAIGTDEVANLASAMAAAPVATGTLFDFAMKGEVYQVFADALDRDIGKATPEERQMIESGRELYVIYAKMFKRINARTALTDAGIELNETVEFNP